MRKGTPEENSQTFHEQATSFIATAGAVPRGAAGVRSGVGWSDFYTDASGARTPFLDIVGRVRSLAATFAAIGLFLTFKILPIFSVMYEH